MQPEIEVKFLNVNHDELRARLTTIGAAQVQPFRLMRRKNFDFPDNRLTHDKHGWVRIRDEGDKVTMSYKQLNDRTLYGTQEVNVVVDSFEKAEDFLGRLGLEQKSYQETKRESWRLDNFQIELDEWPWVAPYIEIEGPDEASLRQLAQQLGLDWEQACYGSVEVVYQAQYDVTDDEFDAIRLVTFETQLPDFLRIKRNDM
jgi:adenylate cyclase class 2